MAGALILLAALATSASAFEIVVPAYFYPAGPSNPWATMTAAADDVDITAIMNPGNGPGTNQDSNYVTAVNSFRAAGGRVIGYVYSSYGQRPVAEVTADVDKYAQLYNIDGIFVDEMANTGPAERLNYYKSIYDHAKAINPEWEVMGNPGTNTIEQYLDWPTADRLMIFENVGSAYPGATFPPWIYNRDRTRFVHLVHTESSAQDMEQFVSLAVQRNTGAIYVTNDVLNNPWDTLPSYWQGLVEAVAEVHDSYDDSDFNEDGVVDGDDLARWRAGFAKLPGRSRRQDGDANDDGHVNGADFLIWQRTAGANAEVAAEATPEPTSLVMAAITLAWLFLTRGK